jgi:putative transposase
MSYTPRINEQTWQKLYKYLRDFEGIYTRNEEKVRRFVEAVLWMSRSGAQWRLLPAEYGHWNTVYKRFADWADKGVWNKMLDYFAQDPDMEYIMIDSTILRAHACAAGGKGGSKNKL